MNDLVSIIIPVYNVEQYVSKCIESVVNQTYKNIEVFLLDDGSTDKSGEICDLYAQKDSRIKVIHKKNSGVSDTRNLGIAKAEGKYIYFIDSDDYIDSNMIEELINNVGVDHIIKSSRRVIKGNKEKEISFEGEYSPEQFIKQVVSGNVGGHCWGYLLNKNLIKDVLFDKETYCMEDTIFIIECILKAKKIKCIGDSFYNHVINPNGITCSDKNIEKNIINYDYSINRINEELNKKRINLQDELLLKELQIVEAEIAKAKAVKTCRTITESTNIQGIIFKIKNKIRIPFKYQTFAGCIIKRKAIILAIYCKMRALVKRFIQR